MCGIFGYLTRTNPESRSASLEIALRELAHRGPDGAGSFTDDGETSCGLAHTQLAIIDRSDASQEPMTSADGRYTLVFNGEIYNFAELRADLIRDGVKFRSTGDAEVLLEGFAHWGKACVPRLRGMFAFAIWDSRERRLFLVRDRFGVKPLYYIERPDGVAFSSEVRTLLKTRDAEPVLSPMGMVSYLDYGSVSEPHTILRDVHALEPGTLLECDRTTWRVERYWELPMREVDVGADDAAHRIRGLLEESVRLRMIADVPIGIFLSGGIDSSAIVALASAAAQSPIHTLTVSFDHAAFDEGAYAADVARRFGCTHVDLKLLSNEIPGEIESPLRALDLPSADGVNSFFVSRAAREAGLTVALSGLGGDEVFAGYSTFQHFRTGLAVKRALPLPTAFRSFLRRCTRTARIPNRGRKLLAFTASDPDGAALYRVLRGMFTDEQRDLLLGRCETPHAGRTSTVDDALRRGDIGPVSALSAFELTGYLRNTLLRDTDCMSMDNGLEVREPLLDHELVEYTLQLAGALKLRRGVKKPLFTDAVHEVPHAARTRSKMGFTLPFEPWLRGPLKSWAEERLLGPECRRAEWVNPVAVENLWKHFQNGAGHVTWSRIWTLAVALDWQHRHGLRI